MDEAYGHSARSTPSEEIAGLREALAIEHARLQAFQDIGAAAAYYLLHWSGLLLLARILGLH